MNHPTYATANRGRVPSYARWHASTDWLIRESLTTAERSLLDQRREEEERAAWMNVRPIGPIDPRSFPSLPMPAREPITYAPVPVRYWLTRSRISRMYDDIVGERDRGPIGPDAFPSHTAGSRVESHQTPDEHELDVVDYVETEPEPIIDGRSVPRSWRMGKVELLHDALPTTRRVRGGYDVVTGKARTNIGTLVDLEAEADAWLEAAGYDHKRPDIRRDSVDPFTMLERYDLSARADRAAYRGERRYRRTSHSRRVIAKSTGREATFNLCGKYWADVTYVDATGYDYVPATWPADLELPERPWTCHAQSTKNTQRKANSRLRLTAIVKPTANTKPKHKGSDFTGSAVPASTVLARESQMANMTAVPPTVASDAPTAVYGRLVTPWSASRRSLPRIVARVVGARDQAEQLEAILSTSQTGVPIVLNPQVTVRVYGALVDDGEHDPMPVSEWARRAAVAGVAID